MADPREDREVTEHPLANYPRPPPRGEDLPYDDGEPMESMRHREQMNLLIDSLADHQEDPSTFFVGGNMFVYFSETQAKKNDFRGPDVFVVLGRPTYDRKSWVAWEEDGHLPDVVIELLSPKTEKVDRGVKMRIYRDVMKVSRYYLYDPFTQVFEGYALVDGRYERIEAGEHGRLECQPLELELGVHETPYHHQLRPMLRWFTPKGELLEYGRERADKERERADKERERANEERERANEERERANEEQERANEERERADALARRVAELERQLQTEEDP